LIAWQSGDLKLAEYDLNVSTRAFGDFTDHYTRQEAFLDLSDLAASQGQTAQAIAYGMQAFDAIDQYNLTGPGSLGDNPYAAWVFHRSSLPGDVLPGLLRPDMSTRLALRYIALGDRLQADGQIAGACRIYQRVLQSVPDLADGIAAVKQYCGKIR
jgi:tetratricopeptide (TPR) repeat protein